MFIFVNFRSIVADLKPNLPNNTYGISLNIIFKFILKYFIFYTVIMKLFYVYFLIVCVFIV